MLTASEDQEGTESSAGKREMRDYSQPFLKRCLLLHSLLETSELQQINTNLLKAHLKTAYIKFLQCTDTSCYLLRLMLN